MWCIVALTGRIFSIQEFSVYDGPGIRTSVFLKGCPLKCSWCHNPEGQSFDKQILRSPNGCINCASCEKYATKNADGSICYTKESIKNCPKALLRESGEDIEAHTLCNSLIKNAKVLQNGGVTFSGGEPLSQSEFVLECLEIIDDRLNTCIQTSGFCEPCTFLRVLEKAHYFLYDLKLMDNELSKKYIGAKNDWIKHNFLSLVQSKKPFTVRVPLIPTVTDTEKNITEICEFLSENSVNYAELLPYNKMAGAKYALAGREYKPQFDASAEVQIHSEIFKEYNIDIKVL